MEPTTHKKRNKRKAKSSSPVKHNEPIPVGDGASPTRNLSSAKKKSGHKAKKSKPVIETIATDIKEKYPILQDDELVKQFMNVPMNNNQKGRIRQAVKDSLQGTSNALVPSIINGKIRDILDSSANLTDSQLRRIRILYNLLKTALKKSDEKKHEDDANAKKKPLRSGDNAEKKPPVQTKKQKRYVVFLGNLPLDVDKEKIINHFSEMNEQIKDVRIPKIKAGRKSAIAYVELTNEPSYEFALSKHHSMMGKRRISVLFTTQKNGKITKAQAKSKSAKLIALQRSGKLMGSIPLARKRSQRRAKLKMAKAKENKS